MFINCVTDVFPWLKQLLSDYMSHEMFIHVYFAIKLSCKVEGMNYLKKNDSLKDETSSKMRSNVTIYIYIYISVDTV